MITDDGALPIEVPRDRAGTFEPLLVGKYERRFTGFDDKIIALYARGMTVRDIQAHLRDLYVVDVSPQLISEVTDAVLGEVGEWQSRPLERLYPVVFFDALRVKMRDEGVVCNKAVYLAIGVLPDGTRDVLGLWIEQTESPRLSRRLHHLRGWSHEKVEVFPRGTGAGRPDGAGAPEGPRLAVGRIIYTTNAIESLHMQLRKIIKTRGHFPSDEAASKLIWLALRNIMATWRRSTREWKSALNQFAILYADRFTPASAA